MLQDFRSAGHLKTSQSENFWCNLCLNLYNIILVLKHASRYATIDSVGCNFAF